MSAKYLLHRDAESSRDTLGNYATFLRFSPNVANYDKNSAKRFTKNYCMILENRDFKEQKNLLKRNQTVTNFVQIAILGHLRWSLAGLFSFTDFW